MNYVEPCYLGTKIVTFLLKRKEEKLLHSKVGQLHTDEKRNWSRAEGCTPLLKHAKHAEGGVCILKLCWSFSFLQCVLLHLRCSIFSSALFSKTILFQLQLFTPCEQVQKNLSSLWTRIKKILLENNEQHLEPRKRRKLKKSIVEQLIPFYHH